MVFPSVLRRPLPGPLASARLRLPVLAAPMFIVSGPELVIAQCKAGVIGSFPALNARPKEQLADWIDQIQAELAEDASAAPFAVNQIVHQSNDRLDHDLRVCIDRQVPLIVTSLRAPGEVVPAVQAYGGLVFHDVISVRHAEKAIEAGVDGLILVCAGAGGHASTLSPFALTAEIRRFWDGPIVLSGAISTGGSILAAQALGADLAYIGTRFIATDEARAQTDYKQTLVEAQAADIVNSAYFTGVAGNYLRQSIERAGLDPQNLPTRDKTSMNFSADRTEAKAWKHIWGAGQGVGSIESVLPVAEVVSRLAEEYAAARQALCR